MTFDPKIHGFDNPDQTPGSENRQGRKSIRLKGYDYSQAGGYFITIVTQLREPFFGKICNGEMLFSEAGEMVLHEWEILPERFPNIEIDVFQVMPNHFHAILLIHNPKSVGAGLVPAPGLVPAFVPVPAPAFVPAPGLMPARERATTRVAPTLGDILGAYKSITTHKYIQGVEEFAWPAFTKRLWKRNYFEHIIRNEADYERTTGYILDNPINWEQDSENPLVYPPSGDQSK